MDYTHKIGGVKRNDGQNGDKLWEKLDILIRCVIIKAIEFLYLLWRVEQLGAAKLAAPAIYRIDDKRIY